MAPKPGNFAIIEGIQAEMKTNPHLTIFWQNRPTAVSPTGKVIDLGKEFGDARIPRYTAIDEEWYVGACAGECRGDTEPDAVAGPGDQGSPPCEVAEREAVLRACHGCLLCRRGRRSRLPGVAWLIHGLTIRGWAIAVEAG